MFDAKRGFTEASVSSNIMGISSFLASQENNDWVKKCMEYEVEGARPTGRPKQT